MIWFLNRVANMSCFVKISRSITAKMMTYLAGDLFHFLFLYFFRGNSHDVFSPIFHFLAKIEFSKNVSKLQLFNRLRKIPI